MEILMSGEIYIKRGPDIIKSGHTSLVDDLSEFGISDDEEFEMLLDELEEDSNAPDRLFEDLRKYHEEEKEELRKRNRDFSGCDSFWMSIIGEDGIEMIEKAGMPEFDLKRKYKSKEELDKDFIRLRVFLEKAKYIGKTFRRTTPLYGRNPMGERIADMSYQYRPPLALYATDDHILILLSVGYNIKNPIQRFSLVSSKYLEDGNYEFYGEVNEEYRDKAELYQAIFKQITDNKKKTL